MAVCKSLEVMYLAREAMFHLNIRTPRKELKIRQAAEYFLQDSRCLDGQ